MKKTVINQRKAEIEARRKLEEETHKAMEKLEQKAKVNNVYEKLKRIRIII